MHRRGAVVDHARRPASTSIDTSDKQQIVALMVPNGAGKTTLFEMIAGPMRRSSGRIVVAW